MGRTTATVLGVVMLASVTRAAHADAQRCVEAADQGQSLRDEGHYKHAREVLASCAIDACPPAIAQACTRWVRELDDAMPSVVFAAKDARGADVIDVAVTVDGAPLVASLDGRPVALDPGAHAFAFTRTGGARVSMEVLVRAGEKNRLLTAAFTSGEAPSPSGAPAPSGEPAPPAEPATAEEPRVARGPTIFTARNLTALALVVAGAAGIGAGVYFGSQSQSDADRASGLRNGLASDACNGASPASACSSLADAVSAQRSDATWSDVLLGGGALLAVGGVAAWLLWPSPTTATAPPPDARLVPFVEMGRAGLVLRGGF